MIKFNTCKLTPSILDQWIHCDLNVLLMGEKGVGKSHQILDAFKRNNLKYAYFSGATLDPYIHLIGIPKSKEQSDGTEKMEFILPSNLDNDVEAIFCDEWNRTPKIVRNALLELQQFKSINGRKFPNLKIVWGAINPPKDEDDDQSYDVDELDPAQLDRFHIIVELPNEPDLTFFKRKFGDYHGQELVKWWKEQPKESKKILSPRRLDYIGECFFKGVDIKYLLPISANSIPLIKALAMDPEESKILKLLNSPNINEMKTFMENQDNVLKFKKTLSKEKYWEYWKYANVELINNEITQNKSFANYAIYRVMKGDSFYINRIKDIASANSDSEIIKILKELKRRNFKLKDEISLDEIVKGIKLYKFSTLKEEDYDKTIAIDGVDIVSIIKDMKNHQNYELNLSPYFTSITNKQSSLPLHTCKSLLNALTKFYLDGISDDIEKSCFINTCLIFINSTKTDIIHTLSNKIIKLIGTACVLAKEIYSEETLKLLMSVINKFKKTLSFNRLDEYSKYLFSEESAEPNSGVPLDLVKEISNIRAPLKDVLKELVV